VNGADYDAHRAANIGRQQALRSLGEAFKRGTRRSKLRQLVVVCPADHLLLEVFPTSDGPLVIARQRRHEPSPGSPVYGPHRYVSRARAVTTMLAGLGDQQTLTAECGCREAPVPVGWLRARLAGKNRRVMFRADV
jgi:hypothetical protein